MRNLFATAAVLGMMIPGMAFATEQSTCVPEGTPYVRHQLNGDWFDIVTPKFQEGTTDTLNTSFGVNGAKAAAYRYDFFAGCLKCVVSAAGSACGPVEEVE